jgi:NADH-quinone oxidoreductase subunit D
VLELDGERIARCTPHIGYLHSGFEKLGEHLDYNQYVTIVSRMNYLSPIANDIAWHHAVEKLFGIEITPRCKVLRTIMAELARIQDHLLCLGAAALDLGAFTGFLYGFNPREKIYDICDFIAGQRYHPDWTRVGGAMQDLPDEETFKTMVKNFIQRRPLGRAQRPRQPAEPQPHLHRPHPGRRRADQGERDGVVEHGPIARAVGRAARRPQGRALPLLRRQLGRRGRRGREVQRAARQRGRCLRPLPGPPRGSQAGDEHHRAAHRQHPGGPMDTFADSQDGQAAKDDVYGSIEGLIQHFELVMTNRGWEPPVAEAYGCNETANGELGYYIISDGGPRPWRVKTRPPSFINYSLMPQLIEGHMLADIVAVLGSLNIVAAELDSRAPKPVGPGDERARVLVGRVHARDVDVGPGDVLARSSSGRPRPGSGAPRGPGPS